MCLCASHNRRLACLKYLVLANMLMKSGINPFDSQEVHVLAGYTIRSIYMYMYTVHCTCKGPLRLAYKLLTLYKYIIYLIARHDMTAPLVHAQFKTTLCVP